MASSFRARLIAGVLVFGLGAPLAVAAAPPTAPAAAEDQPDVVDQPAPGAPKDLWYGAAARLRWVSVPKWLLNGFTKENVPLSSWATGLELFRRKGNFEFAIAFSYQNMSPPDGNWLGSSANPLTETNFVHFDNFAMYGFDASLLWHTYINEWFGLRYGAGFGIGILGGHIVRTYARNGQCTAANASDTSVCKPGPGDQPFTSGSVPPAVPILNVDVGVNFRIPRAKGLEVRLDGGFYDAFFLGGAIAYAY